jgi:hypothetical protein
METPTKTEHRCQYCDKVFLREQTLAVHVCEQKKRYQDRDEAGARLGFQAYLRFYEMLQGSSKLKTFDDFAKSAYYRAFVRFGRHCVGINAINVARFIDWVVSKNKKIDHWCRDAVYTEYLHDYLRLENVSDALGRAVEYSIKWSEEHGCPAQDLLRYGNSNLIAYAVTTGRISPWALYNCDSGQQWLEQITQEQTSMIWPWIDPEFWQRKFQEYPADQMYAREILNKAGW